MLYTSFINFRAIRLKTTTKKKKNKKPLKYHKIFRRRTRFTVEEVMHKLAFKNGGRVVSKATQFS